MARTAKKKVDEAFNIDAVLFKFRDILRNARNSGFRLRILSYMMPKAIRWLPSMN